MMSLLICSTERVISAGKKSDLVWQLWKKVREEILSRSFSQAAA
jgi:hypothetical protein